MKIIHQPNEPIFARKYVVEEEEVFLETCPYCGIKAESVCDSPPPDVCEQAINQFYGDPTK